MAYKDGSGADGWRALGVFSEGTCATRTRSYGFNLGTTASVADSERLVMALALEREHPGQPLALLSDSKAAISTLFHLAYGGTPRSGIEKRIKDSLHSNREIRALWVRSHIGIPGNEAADRRATLEMI